MGCVSAAYRPAHPAPPLPEARLRARFGLRRCTGVDAPAVFRSRALDSADESDAAALYALGVRTVIDLRKPKERLERPNADAVLERFEVLDCAIDLQNDARRTQPSKADDICAAYGEPGERMTALYRGMALHADTIRDVLERIRSARGGVLVHCANGKDRSGVICASLQVACGVDARTVLVDYLQTNRANATMNRRDLARLAATKTPDELAVLAAMFEAREEYLLVFFSAIEARFGSVQRWLS